MSVVTALEAKVPTKSSVCTRDLVLTAMAALIVLAVGIMSPYRNWDMVGYVAAALRADGYHGADLNAATYETLRNDVSPRTFDQMIEGEYRETSERSRNGAPDVLALRCAPADDVHIQGQGISRMRPHLFLALARPYRPRQPWEDYAELLWAAAAIVFLVGSLIAWVVRQRQQSRADKHAALDRVRAQHRGR